MAGRLFVVATPIGNLADMTPRASQTLADCALIAAEDTRHSKRLLTHLGVDTPLRSMHEHSNQRAYQALIERLQSGEDIALISDAGTPLISDPGFELVRLARQAGVDVLPIPGPCAAVAALSVAGLPTDQFEFRGFPPTKTKARRAFFDNFAQRPATQVFYEASHRVAESVADLAIVFGADRQALLARELTKLHEQTVRTSLATLAGQLNGGGITIKGEFVIVVAGFSGPATDDRHEQARRLLRELLKELPASRAAKVAASVTGLPKRDCYALAEQLPTD